MEMMWRMPAAGAAGSGYVLGTGAFTVSILRPPASQVLGEDHLRAPLPARDHRVHVLRLVGDEVHEDEVVLAAERLAERRLDVRRPLDQHAMVAVALGQLH